MKYALITPDGKVAAYHERDPEGTFILPSDEWRLIPADEAAGLENAPLTVKPPSAEMFHVEQEDIYLKVDADAQNAFTRLLTLMQLAGAPDDYVVQIADYLDQPHALTYGRLKEVLLAYGLACYTQTGLS